MLSFGSLLPRIGTSVSLALQKTTTMLPNSWNIMASRGMANARHKKIVKMAKGYRGRANRCFTVALHRVNKAKQYAYRDRKVQKRNARTLWIQRINAGVRLHGMKYNHFINRLHLGNVQLNRKVLADIAVTEPLSFKSVVEVAKV
jgi:large subunit ribosomal protein L20